MCISGYWWWDWWAREESVAPAAVPQAGRAVRRLHVSSVLRSGREVAIDWFCRKREDLPEWRSKLFCVLPFPLLCCVSDDGGFFYLLWSCFTVSIRILQIWELKSSYYFNDHKQPSTGIFYCILLHFITFLLFRLKETCLFTIWGVFFMRYIFSLAVCKACLPWDVYKKAIMLRAVPILQA